MTKKILMMMFCLCLVAGVDAQAASDRAMAPSDKQLAALYWQGHDALKNADWSTALARFSRLESDLQKQEPASADAAVYWQAYALFQARRTAEARSTVERLQRNYPDSRWLGDAQDLLRQSQAGSAMAAVGEDDEELAEIAVAGLMQAPAERALPILRKVLNGSQPTQVKKRALFVLSQLDEDVALDTLTEFAKTSRDEELRADAIRMLGVSGEDRAIENLRSIYSSASDAEDKRSIIQAWLIADRADLVMQSASHESDEELRKEAIQALGAMDATAELRSLFESEKSAENRKAILQSLGVAGDSDTLARIATSNQPEDIRVEAIRAIGIADEGDAGTTLAGIYKSASSEGIRQAALQGMLIAGDGDVMLGLYREAGTREEKKALLRMITLTDGDAALDLIEAELDKGSDQP
ncbi:HEAT repeat domain-containing protein [Dokdonella sp.]|uniref:HEAT repeat domain-containing protein n=1 Tax=Dokdonella sp. TaxID=2291710 RepID=UPI0035289F8A